jgi:hypothetical protein
MKQKLSSAATLMLGAAVSLLVLAGIADLMI